MSSEGMATERLDYNEVPQLTCPLCANTEFQREEGRLDSMWGWSNHILILMICTRCRHVLQFYDGNSIFDFD